jgi:hypothetical protein
MNNHLTRFFSNDANMAKAKELYGHSCDIHHIVTEEEIKATAAEAEKHAFIQANMDEYMKLYFPQTANRSTTSDTFICVNGGFEDSLLYYKGYVSTFTTGSNTCEPNVPGWLQVPLPRANRFEILSLGNDPIVGIPKVKFGNQSLRINNSIGHSSTCSYGHGVDKIVKTFEVTAENRDFTIWFALVLNVAPGHDDYQSFLSIKCDKAPNDELCFDADFLANPTNYVASPCGIKSIATLDWACHKFRIPEESIGQLATLEILIADCGAGGHFGYGYIDGICEPCDDSFGSVGIDTTSLQYYSCDGLTARVCGSYNLPTFCEQCTLSNVNVPGFTIQNIDIDHSSRTFCFDFPITNFTTLDCIDFFTELTYSYNGSSLPPLPSDTIEICKSDFRSYSYTATVGQCYDNATTENISDDYYFVTVTISDPNSNGWILKRQLIDPYPNESGLYTHATGSGNSTVVLGPFLIQEGCWRLLLSLPGCDFDELICPPDFCSGCEELRNIKIGNIQCYPATSNPASPSTWSFDVFVTSNLIGSYDVNNLTNNSSTSGNYNTVKTISGLSLRNSCIDFVIIDKTDPLCKAYFTVCPPKPCQPFPNDCDLELVVPDVECVDKDGSYMVTLDIWNVGSDHLCYSTTSGPSPTLNSVPSNGQIGPFNGDITIIIYSCSGSDCSNCIADNCYKVVRVFEPDCDSGHFDSSSPPRISNTTEDIVSYEMKVIPNPINQQEIRIVSSLTRSSIEIYNTTALLVHKTEFTGSEFRWNMSHLPSGNYFVKYQDNDGNIRTIKFVKL